MSDTPDPENSSNSQHSIMLSPITETLLEALKKIKGKALSDEYTRLTVSQTVSFLALVYEKVRNAIEYREDHLIRRAAIERILKRRFALNPEAKNEAENVLRELLWARYFPNGSLGAIDVSDIQKIIDKYISIRKQLLTGRNSKTKRYLSEFLFQIITAEIEEFLSPAESEKEANFSYFIFQTLKSKVKIEDLNEQQKDIFLFIAIEKAYRKSDQAYQRYHLFRLYYKPIFEHSEHELQDFIPKMSDFFRKLDDMISQRTVEKLVRFTRKQLPPFLILFSLINKYPQEIREILMDKNSLWVMMEKIAREKYSFVRSRLNILAFRSLIYIFITKMALALVIEIPLSQYLYGDIHILSIAINSIAPPVFMLFIILTVSVPSENNTKRLFLRIADIIDSDPSFEKATALITKKVKNRRPLLSFGFSLLYTSTFVVTLYLIHAGLDYLKFNLLSQGLFVFFISVVAFFAYRIKQVSDMYRLTEKGSFFTPIVDFFFMPILSLGKVFSEGVSRINFFILIFDFIIEAPFKLIIEVIEEWITFVRNKKEDIV